MKKFIFLLSFLLCPLIIFSQIIDIDEEIKMRIKTSGVSTNTSKTSPKKHEKSSELGSAFSKISAAVAAGAAVVAAAAEKESISWEIVETKVELDYKNMVKFPIDFNEKRFTNLNCSSERRGFVESYSKTITIGEQFKVNQKFVGIKKNTKTSRTKGSISIGIPIIKEFIDISGEVESESTNVNHREIKVELFDESSFDKTTVEDVSKELDIKVNEFSVLETIVTKQINKASIPFSGYLIFDGYITSTKHRADGSVLNKNTIKLSDTQLDRKIVFNGYILTNQSEDVDVKYFETELTKEDCEKFRSIELKK